MVYEQSKKKCISPGGFEMCDNKKTIYIREIKDRKTIDKEVISSKTGNLLTRTQTTHKMKWVPIGTFCSSCLNIDYYPSWLKANKKKYEWIRHENKKRKIITHEERLLGSGR
jgi:hypothetical protein